MSQSLSKIYVHIIFSTKKREASISKEIEDELYAYMAKIFMEYDSFALIIGGVENHIHILCILSKNYSVCKLIEEIKKSSSKWIKTKDKKYSRFSWQNGYGVFSVSQSQVPDVQNYIQTQKEHHKKISFEEEYREFLNKYKIKYDEQYVWD